MRLAAPRLEYAGRNRPVERFERTENQAKGKNLAHKYSRRAKLSPDSYRTRAFSIHLLTSLALFKVAVSWGNCHPGRLQGHNREHWNGTKRLGPPRHTAADARHRSLLFPRLTGRRDDPGVQHEKLILRKTLSVSSKEGDSSMFFITIGAQRARVAPERPLMLCLEPG